MRPAVVVEHLSKQFTRHQPDRPMTIMEAALQGWRIKPQERFYALQDVSLAVYPGEMLGIIGKNGAGKSTLLQLIGGVGRPDRGYIKVNGQLGALLDIGAGFHTDLTGKENVFVGGIVAGLTRREVARRLEAIVEFAELQEFIDNPLRTYSTGMQMRLGFSVAVHTNPRILLVDEFLSVGDVAFQAKCLNRIAELKEQGCAIIWVSHDAERVGKLCDRALWLRQGQVAAYGEPEIVAGQYTSEMHAETIRRTPSRPVVTTQSGLELQVNQNRFGSLEVEITDVRLLPQGTIKSGEPLQVEIEYFAPETVDAPIVNVSISREEESPCFNTNTTTIAAPLLKMEGKGELVLEIDRLDLAGGLYYVDVSIYKQNWEYAYDYHWHAYPLEVRSPSEQKSILSPPHRWKVRCREIKC